MNTARCGSSMSLAFITNLFAHSYSSDLIEGGLKGLHVSRPCCVVDLVTGEQSSSLISFLSLFLSPFFFLQVLAILCH